MIRKTACDCHLLVMLDNVWYELPKSEIIEFLRQLIKREYPEAAERQKVWEGHK